MHASITPDSQVINLSSIKQYSIQHGPKCVHRKTQKFDLYTTELNTNLSLFSHNSKIVQKYSLKGIHYGTGPHVKIFKQKKKF